MRDEQLNPWSFDPINLNNQEIHDPFLVITEFFSSDDVPGHLSELLEWRSCVLAERYYLDAKGSPSGLLFTYQLTIKLIESIQLLSQVNWSKQMMTTAIHCTQILEQEKNNWSYFPDNLSQIELLNPFFVVKDFFKLYSLPQYRGFLYEWLEHGLSSKAANEFVETADVINVYENLQKLYAAAWVIHQRTSDEAYVKDVPISIINEVKSNLYNLNKSINQNSREVISKLISIIRHKLESVQAVIYLGVPSGSPSVLFLLILTANDELRQAQALNAMLEESCLPVAKIIALTHHQSFLTNSVKEENLFVRNALKCPVVYLSGDLILPDGNFGQCIIHQNRERWLKQGKDFLNGAKYYLNENATNAALFSMHQAAECLLIAIIRAVLGYRVNNHNLHSLLKITQMFTGELIAIFDLEDLESKQRFYLLQHAYVNVRYKDNFETDRDAVEALIVPVTELMNKAEQLYKLHLNTSNL